MTLPKCQCTAEHMGSFYATPCTTDCLQMVYSIYTCQNWISVPNIVLNHWKIHSRSDFQDAINGILRLTNDGERATEQSNDVSLVWRYSSWVRSRPLERAYRRRFLTVLKKFEPQIVVGHRVDPKRHFLTLQRVFWAIVRQNPSTGHFSRRVRGKNKNKKEEALYFTYFARRSLTTDWHKFWVTCSSRGRHQLCKVLS